jgi:hypothetical protein
VYAKEAVPAKEPKFQVKRDIELARENFGMFEKNAYWIKM